MDLKCRIGRIKPEAVVIVATVRALKHHGFGELSKGLDNLGKHIENMGKFGLKPVVAINKFNSDTEAEIKLITNYCQNLGAAVALNTGWAEGGTGAIDVAQKVLDSVKTNQNFHYLYDLDTTIQEKIETIAKEIYGADGVIFSDSAKLQMKKYEDWGMGNLPICMAKTQYSLSDNPTLRNRPSGFKISIKSIRLSAGAGFFVAITGDIMTMPGLPKVPSAEVIDIDGEGKISGLF